MGSRFRSIVGALATVALAAGQDARPQFDVASIKPNNSGSPSMKTGTPGGGRYQAENVPLLLLIQRAWDLRPFQIIGIPDSLTKDRFDIEAASQPGASQEQMSLMVQRLLEERFRLRVHQETRELGVLNLTVARNGTKLRPLAEGACLKLGPGQRPPAPEPGSPPAKICGGASWGPKQIKTNAESIATFVSLLGEVMEITVVDKTGLEGLFDIALTWTPDAATPDLSGPSIFTAIQEQLGLRLESAKAPVRVLVVDSVEKPSEN